ncbi:MAG: BrnT family toxin [Rhizomicrobium sp.]
MLEFEWNPRKSESNRRKHGLTFEDAIRLFHDPLRRLDIEGDEHGEIRWRTTGAIDGVLHVVSHTIREEGETEIYRIITARRATPRESKVYEEAP